MTAFALLSLAATLALGRWQLSRAAQKEAWQNSITAQGALPPLEGVAMAAQVDSLPDLHRRVILRGRWMAANTVFLDNRQMHNQPGLYVLTPLEIEGSEAVVLVQRGWVARNFMDRTRLPQLQTPAGRVEIQGRIAASPSKLYEFAGANTGRIRQNLDLAAFGVELGRPLLPVSVQQTGVASEGLLREWPVFETGVDKHYGYAFQWFALGALIAVLYVWFQIVRRFIYSRRT